MPASQVTLVVVTPTRTRAAATSRYEQPSQVLPHGCRLPLPAYASRPSRPAHPRPAIGRRWRGYRELGSHFATTWRDSMPGPRIVSVNRPMSSSHVSMDFDRYHFLIPCFHPHSTDLLSVNSDCSPCPCGRFLPSMKLQKLGCGPDQAV